MLSTFASVRPYIKFRYDNVLIDNIAFKLHYRWTFSILIACTILVSARQYIGSHIECISEGAIPTRVINTFCFFTPTYTIVNHLNETALNAGAVPHPGIGPDTFGKDSIKRHAYYQWVPFVLFAQAICFYLPHALWKHLEGGTIHALTRGLKMVQISKYMPTSEKFEVCGRSFPAKDTVDTSAITIKTTFINRLKVNKYWGSWLILCEFLNFLNVLLQIRFADLFLAGQFLGLGPKVVHEDWSGMDVLDIVFPKVTKCTFRKFGPSGTVQVHDSLCIMALNVVNEKIYTFLWFWFMFLLAASALALLWRLLTLFLHRSSAFNDKLFSYACARRVDRQDIEVVTQNCSYANWLFLYYLAKSMDDYIFQQVLKQLAEEFCRCGRRERQENDANQQTEQDEEGDSWEKPKSIDSVDSTTAELLFGKS